MILDGLKILAALAAVVLLVAIAYFSRRRRMWRRAPSSKGSYLHCHHVPHEDGTWSIITVRRDLPEDTQDHRRRTMSDRFAEWLRKHAD